MISVVIPAHNEEQVLGRCLARLLAGDPGDVDIVVVCNGCHDRTAEVARSFGPPVRVEVVSQASKPAALNVGDTVSRHFPRLYLDADVLVDGSTVRAVAAAVSSGAALAAAPERHLDMSRSTWPVRAYLAVWSRLPSVDHTLAGRGLYALSATGRDRFGAFPDVIADDGFVASKFTPGEVAIVRAHRIVVVAPRRLGDLLRRRVRVHLGNRQVAGSSRPARLPGSRPWRPGLVHRPADLLHVAVFLAVTALARLGAAWRAHRGIEGSWGRDESSRLPPR